MLGTNLLLVPLALDPLRLDISEQLLLAGGDFVLLLVETLVGSCMALLVILRVEAAVGSCALMHVLLPTDATVGSCALLLVLLPADATVGSCALLLLSLLIGIDPLSRRVVAIIVGEVLVEVHLLLPIGCG